MKENKFIVIIPVYEFKNLSKELIESIINQRIKNLEIIFIYNKNGNNNNIESYIKKKIPQFFFNNYTGNIYSNLLRIFTNININDEDIILILKEGLYFKKCETLEIINNIFNKENCWFFYCNFYIYPENLITNFKGYPDFVLKKRIFRKVPFIQHLPKVFKYFLFKNIKIKDMKDASGKFFIDNFEQALSYPMLEMSTNKIKFYRNPLFNYYFESIKKNEENKNLKFLLNNRFLRFKPVYKDIIK